jgi:hypothetical protein
LLTDWVLRRLDRRFGLWAAEGSRFSVEDSAFWPGLRVLSAGQESSPAVGGLLVGTFRMGYGHYRMAMSVVSQALARGVTSCWFDFLALDAPASRSILHIEGLYSRGSRWASRHALFDRVWEGITGSGGWGSFHFNEAFAPAMIPLFGELDRGTPFVSSHVFNGVAAVAAGFQRVVHLIPDNSPLPFHIVRGAVNVVQSPSMYQGYRQLGLSAAELRMVGHYVDQEFLEHLEADCAARVARARAGAPRRLLFSIGGAGAQGELVLSCLRFLAPHVLAGRAAVVVNVGDHQALGRWLVRGLESTGLSVVQHEGWAAMRELAAGLVAEDSQLEGVHLVHMPGHFAAVQATNLLIRGCDVLVAKPSELSYYPAPKLFLRRVGRHEALGAIRGAELGESTGECRTLRSIGRALEVLLGEPERIEEMCAAILRNAAAGVYDGARAAVALALEGG